MNGITETCLNERQRKPNSSCEMLSIKYKTKMKERRKLRLRIAECPSNKQQSQHHMGNTVPESVSLTFSVCRLSSDSHH